MSELIAWLPSELQVLPRYLVALAIGLLMGLERERNPSAKAGLRTFALTALLGTLASHLAERAGSPWLIAAGLLLTGGMMIAAYLRPPQEEGDPGTTTVAALMVCYGLGVLTWLVEIKLAVMLGIAATILLYFKPELRGLSERLTRRDLLSVLQFAVLSFIILPRLPNRDYGPYGALNPYQIWWMVVLIAGLGLAGYAALRLGGQRRGAAVLGLRLHNLGKLPVAIVFNAITLVTLANLVLKSALVRVIGGWNMARHAIAGMGAVGLGLIVAWPILRSL